MNEEFVRKHRFRRTKLERPIYVRNTDRTLNYAEPIVDMVEVKIFFKEHKERMLIDMIGEHRWEVTLDIPWLACYNSEIDWRTGEVQMIRCPEECGKKWRIERQTKLRWQKQEEREEQKEKRENEKREEFKRPTTEKEMAIARVIEEKKEKKDEEKDLIELRMV